MLYSSSSTQNLIVFTDQEGSRKPFSAPKETWAGYTVLWSQGGCVILAAELFPTSAAALPMLPGCAGTVLNNLVPQSMDLVALMSYRSAEGTAQALEGRDRCTLVCAHRADLAFHLVCGWCQGDVTHVESPWLPVQRVALNTAARLVTGMNSCAIFPGKNRKALCASNCWLFVGSSLSSCHEHWGLKNKPKSSPASLCLVPEWGAGSIRGAVLDPSFLSSLFITWFCLDTHMETQAAWECQRDVTGAGGEQKHCSLAKPGAHFSLKKRGQGKSVYRGSSTCHSEGNTGEEFSMDWPSTFPQGINQRSVICIWRLPPVLQHQGMPLLIWCYLLL